MQLKIRRTQRAGGVVSSKTFFCLDAVADFTGDERRSIDKYKLGKEVLYSSETAKRFQVAGDVGMAVGGAANTAKALANFVMARMSLNITVNDIENGKHIECKDMEELLAAEEAILGSCQKLKLWLETAATFDGREVVIDLSDGTDPRVDTPTLQAPKAPGVDAPRLSGPQAPAPLMRSTTASKADDEDDFAQKALHLWRDLPTIGKFLVAGAPVVLLLYLFG
jgi:hypothetical protein